MNLNRGITLNAKPISRLDLDLLGKLENNNRIVDTVEEIRNSVPNIVVAKCIRDMYFIQNGSELQKLCKKVNYCMSLGIYSQLQYLIAGGRKIQFLEPGSFKFRNVYKPYYGQNLDNKSILIWRTGGIGDLLFIKPILKYLKNKYPTCRILFSCAPQYRSMVETYPEVDKILNLPFPAHILFDVDYHAIFEGVIERTREAERVNAYELFAKSLNLQIPREELVPELVPKADKVEHVKEILNEWGILGSKFIVIQMRASSPIRTPSPTFWKFICNYITEHKPNYRIVITDSPNQAHSIDAFIKTVNNNDNIYNFSSKSSSLDLSIALVSLSFGVVATDSALTHIAAALRKNILGIYGPFPGFIRMGTYPKEISDWIEPTNCECSPCFIHGHLPCKYSVNGYPQCFEKIDKDGLIEKINKLFPDM